MRTVQIILRDDTGRLEVSETTGCPTDYQPSGPYLREILTDLMHRLDILQRDGPWKSDVEGTIAAADPARLVQQSLNPAPASNE